MNKQARRPKPARLPQRTTLSIAITLAATLAAAMPAHADLPDGTIEARRNGPLVAATQAPLPVEFTPATPANTIVVSNCNDSGAGSLRDAIDSAVSGDTIDMTQLQCSAISLTTGAIVFAQDQLALDGPGRFQLTIHGSDSDSLGGALVHLGSGTLIVRDLTIADGHKYRSDVHALGGCIQSQGNVLIHDAAIVNCSATSQAQFAALGGGVWAQGLVELQKSTVSGCTALASGFGYASGGGVYSNGGFNAFYSLVADNDAISKSTTPTFGGGVFAWDNTLIASSAFVNNQSTRFAGLTLYGRNDSSAVILQSTIADNWATRVGGLFSREPLVLNNSTIAFNKATDQFDTQGNPSAAGLQMGAFLLTFTSNLLAANEVIGVDGWSDLQGLPGVLLTGDHNLITGTLLPPPPDTIGFMPSFGPLRDNGGLTPTRELLGNSFGVNEGATASGTPGTDQRGPGFPRFIGQIDMGAFEFDPDRIFTTGNDFGRTQML